MRSLKRKQLHKLPETVIANISAVPQWFKFVVDYTDIQVAATTKTITLCTLPIKSWIHAVAWKTTVSFSQNGDWNPSTDGTINLLASLGDEDVTAKWLNAKAVLAVAEGGGETPIDIEDAIGLTPYEPDFDNTHDLEAYFSMLGAEFGDNLDDLDAGEMTYWFLLSSMNEGSAG